MCIRAREKHSAIVQTARGQCFTPLRWLPRPSCPRGSLLVIPSLGISFPRSGLARALFSRPSFWCIPCSSTPPTTHDHSLRGTRMLQRTLRDHTPVPGREKHPSTVFAVLTLLLRLSQNCCLPARLCPRDLSPGDLSEPAKRGFRFISYSLCHFFDAVSFFRLFFTCFSL